MENNPDCQYCGKTVRKPEKKFCSQECYYNSRRDIVYKNICPVCNKEFSFKNGAYARLGRMKYCSHECKNRKVIFNERYFSGELTPEKLFTFGQILVSVELFDIPVINIITSKELLSEIQIKLGSDYKAKKTEMDLYRIRFKSRTLYDDLIRLGITKPKFYQEVPRDDLWEGMKSTHSYKEEDDTCTFTSDSSKIARWIQDKFDTEIITKLYRYDGGNDKLYCQYINVWKK